MKKLFMMLSLLLSCTLLAASGSDNASVPDKVFEKINERLGYMKEVGLYKEKNHQPVEDVRREQLVIAKASDSAAQFGLNSDSTKEFFSAQISAAKAIQYRYRADLLSASVLGSEKDLVKEIRPIILRLGDEINEAIAVYLNEGGSFQDHYFIPFEEALQQSYLNRADKRKLFEALQGIRLNNP